MEEVRAQDATFQALCGQAKAEEQERVVVIAELSRRWTELQNRQVFGLPNFIIYYVKNFVCFLR